MSVSSEKPLRDTILAVLSRKVAAAIGAQKNHCAANAWRALIEFPELFRRGGHLVEGWFVIEEEGQVTLVEHVWCELANGLIVDPSVLLLVPETTPVFYFPGLTRDYAETEALEGELFPHVRFDGLHGDDGLGHPGYMAARSAARRKAYALALARKPPKAMQFLTARDPKEAHPPEADVAIAPPVVEGAQLDLQRSLDTCRQIQSVSGQCWYNARKALFDMPNAFLTAVYIEGWVVGQSPDAIRVTEHGWIWMPRTGIVDPTIVLGSVPTRLAYLPGVQLSWLEMQQYRTIRLPLARERGLNSPEYQESCRNALSKAETRAWQTGLPILIEPGGVCTLRAVGETIQIAEVSWEFPVPSTSAARHPQERR
jgi:hypothetical protein